MPKAPKRKSDDHLFLRLRIPWLVEGEANGNAVYVLAVVVVIVVTVAKCV